MSSPYIQVELDAMKKAPLLASVLGIQLREAVGGLTLMWAHVYSERADTISAFYVRAFFGVDASTALTELGFIEPAVSAGLWRVRGAGRYTRLSEIRSDAGRKGAATTNSRAQESGVGGTPDYGDLGRQKRQNPANGRQTVGKTTENTVLPRQTVGKTDETALLPRQKAALEPIADSSLSLRERELATHAAPVTAPPTPSAGAVGEGAENPVDPNRRAPDPDETWDAFADRYPWPKVVSLGLIDPPARDALVAEARRNKQPPIVLLDELSRSAHAHRAQPKDLN